MCLVFLTSAITQSYRYRSSSDHTGRSSVLDADQLESLKDMKGGAKKDKKGLDDVMEELYEKHIANRDLNDWENIRTPRPEEPETYDVNMAKKAALINKRSDMEAKEFSSEDYGKIEEADISLDFDMDADEMEGGVDRGQQYKYHGKVGGVKLPSLPGQRQTR